MFEFNDSYRAGFNAALELIAKSFENIEWARARYDAGVDWSGPLGAFSPHKHAYGCAMAVRKLKVALDG